ncbi:GH25 family lysozyme [Nocardia sp. NPDC088792]|uniref:GH25 family lysozyme n=1 Tax=Nocardia sp. NPDC088792 TaxID=3364332 RepID=UPI0038022AF3
MTILGTDLSANNGVDGVDMGDFKNEGMQFVISRVANIEDPQGHIHDSSYSKNRAQAEKNGLTFAAYAPYYPTKDYKSQADLILGDIGDGVPFMVDVEDEGRSFNMTDYQNFVNYMSSKGHPVKIAYVGTGFADMNTVAKIANAHAPGDKPPIWDRPAYWQPGQQGSVDGLYKNFGGDSNQNWYKQDNGDPLPNGSPAIWQYTENAVGPWTHEPGSPNAADADAFKGNIDDFRQAIGLPPLNPATSTPNNQPTPNDPTQSRPLTGDLYDTPPKVDISGKVGIGQSADLITSLLTGTGAVGSDATLTGPKPLAVSDLVAKVQMSFGPLADSVRKNVNRRLDLQVDTSNQAPSAKSDNSKALAFGRW